MPSLVQEAIDRLYIAAHRVRDASGTDALTAEENLVRAVRKALRVSVSDKKIQQITGFSKERIHALRPPMIPRPRSEQTPVARPQVVVATQPLVWPEWVGRNLAAIKRAESATPRIRVVSGGLPGHGKRR